MMNKYSIITKCALTILLVSFVSLSFAGTYKQVCREVYKNGKHVKLCKKIKIHKKLKGTPVPTDKKNKKCTKTNKTYSKSN